MVISAHCFFVHKCIQEKDVVVMWWSLKACLYTQHTMDMLKGEKHRKSKQLNVNSGE